MAGEKHPHYGVVIIGAGFGGLGMAIALRKQLNYHNFIIFEKGNEVGGTWRANTYPGAASDIPIHAYSYSTDPKYDWQRSHGLQEEILDYIKDVTDKYSLRPHIRLDTSVMKAEWDNAAQHWKVITKEEETEKTTTQTANVLVVASGILEKPTTAGIPGIENFTGTIFHSAQYMHDVDLHGKRVAVIGNGCSATQIVPIIARDPTTSVTSFARTPMWYVDGTHIPYSSVWKWIYTHVPMAELLHRWRIQASYDINFLFFRGSGDHWFQRWQRKELESYIRTTAPKEYHDKLIPNYPPGCRRIIRDKEYLSSLSRPNNKLLFEGVQKITEDGILTTSGNHHQFDVIILATGFITDSFPIEIRGKHGTTITDYYRAHGGPQAYFGSTIPGFPNLLQIQGPNTSTGHASVLFTEECQFNYAVQLFKPVLHKQIDSVDIKDDATDNFNDWIQRRTDTSVFVKCASWYRVGQKGKVAAIWPGAVAVFWWKLLWVKWSDYETQGKHRTLWAVRRRLARSVRLLVAALILGAVGAAGMGRLPGNEMFRMLNARTLSPILRRLPWLGSAGRA